MWLPEALQFNDATMKFRLCEDCQFANLEHLADPEDRHIHSPGYTPTSAYTPGACGKGFDVGLP